MSWLLETITDLAFGLVNFVLRLGAETTRHSHDDPFTAAHNELTRCWLLSFAALVITMLAALFVALFWMPPAPVAHFPSRQRRYGEGCSTWPQRSHRFTSCA